MEIIDRPIYIDRIVSHLNKQMIIILVGQRRVGKSCILQQLQSRIKEREPDANVVYINKELYAFKKVATADDLYEYAVERLSEAGKNYLLIDEVQDIPKYEDALRSLHAENRCQIVATGSNTHIFSTELSTRLSGRYVEIPIYSLTYKEFLLFHKCEDSEQALLDYLRIGGLPGLMHYDIKEETQIRDYLQGVYNTIMMRDVITREEIRNVTFIENLASFMADNIGKLISVRNIANYLKSQGEKITDMITGSYIKHLCGALIIRPVERYDIHGKKLFENNFKYYFSDHGLRNLLCGFNIRGSIEKVMENVVRHHLVTQGFRVTVGILRNGEIDFIASRNSQTLYIQVTYLLGSEETIRREFGNLKAVPDNYPKYVVSMDPVSGELPEYPGIQHVHLRDFLNTIF